jgi:hypothetical protein
MSAADDERRPRLRERVRAKLAGKADSGRNLLTGQTFAEAGRRVTRSVLKELVRPEELERIRQAGEAASRGAVDGLKKNLPLRGYGVVFAAGLVTAGLLTAALLGPLRRRG